MSLNQSNITKITKKIVNNILNEDDIVTGDKGAANITAGEEALSRVKSRLQKLGVYDIPALDGIMTTEQLAIEPFEFDFVLQVPEIQQELNLPKPPRFSTLARVVNDSPFILEVKIEGEDQTFTIQFDEQEMTTNLPGTKKSIRALKTESGGDKGKFYNVILSRNLLEVMEQNSSTENEEESGENKEGKGEQGDKTKKLNKEQLFNDMVGFFKFVVNNKKFLQKKQESIFDDIEKLLLEADVNPSEEKPTETKSYEGRIYIKDITLGPKAKKRKDGDIQNYVQATGTAGSNSTFWKNGLIKDLPTDGGVSCSITLTATNPGNFNPEQKKIFDEITKIVKQKAIIRKSKKDTDNTKFVVQFGKSKAFVGETLQKAVNLRKPNIRIKIGHKAAGEDIFTDSIEATIQILKN